MHKRYIITGVLAIVFVVAMVLFFYLFLGKNNNAPVTPQLQGVAFTEITPTDEIQPIPSGYEEFAEVIVKEFQKDRKISQDKYFTQLGITSHHLPTALTLIAEFYKTFSNSSGPRETFVIFGPDHYERCLAPISTVSTPFQTPFGPLYPDEEIQESLLDVGVKIDPQCFLGEHSMGVQTLFIKYLFPNAKIVPLLFSATTEKWQIEKLVEILSAYKDEISIIASVDFSHYENYSNAEKIDQQSKKEILDVGGNSLTLRNTDSPASLQALLQYAKTIEDAKPIILDHKNSYDFTGQAENTTSYFNVIFVDYSKSDVIAELMFVGDIMLSRNVGKTMLSKKDFQWPFLKIGEHTRKANIFFGNLEGPISDKGYNVGSIYSFRADPKSAQSLIFAGFDVLSVANNHIGDWTRLAMEDTLRILKENNIEYAGGGFSQKEARSAKIVEVKGMKFAFLGYTAIGPKTTEAKGEKSGIAWLDKKAMVHDIAEAKNISDFVIVSAHFGEEYQTQSNKSQQDFAHTAIDSGAKLFIGHHPHVIQETEKYKDGFIAYSLGNFIFDQNFSKETMQGLLLTVRVRNKDIAEIVQTKVNISPEFQVSLEQASTP